MEKYGVVDGYKLPLIAYTYESNEKTRERDRLREWEINAGDVYKQRNKNRAQNVQTQSVKRKEWVEDREAHRQQQYKIDFWHKFLSWVMKIFGRYTAYIAAQREATVKQ